MKGERTFLITILCASLLLWAACRRPEPEINRNMPDDTQPIVVPTVAPGGRDPFANANGNLNANSQPFPTEGTNATTVTELQDSLITSTNDNVGNRIETRVFRANPRLSQIVVITGKNRQKAARVYGNKGEVRELPVSLLLNALILSADELADAVGIAMDKSPKRNATPLPPLEKATPTPKPVVSPSPLPQASPTPKPKPGETPPVAPEPDLKSAETN